VTVRDGGCPEDVERFDAQVEEELPRIVVCDQRVYAGINSLACSIRIQMGRVPEAAHDAGGAYDEAELSLVISEADRARSIASRGPRDREKPSVPPVRRTMERIVNAANPSR